MQRALRRRPNLHLHLHLHLHIPTALHLTGPRDPREGSQQTEPTSAVDHLINPDTTMPDVRPDTSIDNTRRRADKLNPEQHQELTELGIRR